MEVDQKIRYLKMVDIFRDLSSDDMKEMDRTTTMSTCRRGKIFYSCSGYPKCDYAIWNEPVSEPCPRCGWPVLTIKTTKRRGTEKVCPQKECTFSEPVEEQV